MTRISPTIVEIDLQALRFNYRQLKKRVPPGVKILSVVKSNAYGHGAPAVARVLQKEGSDFFGVGTIDEGIELRKAGIRRPILILLGLVGGQAETLVRYRLTPVLYDLKTAEALHRDLVRMKSRLAVHLKVDTGMTRLGILPREFARFLKKLKGLETLQPAGLLTHFSDAGEEGFTRHQVILFEEAQREFRKRFPGKRFFHVANSQAVIDQCSIASEHRSDRIHSVRTGGESGRSPVKQMGGSGWRAVSPPDQWMVRFGIALYGAYPLAKSRKKIALKPVLRWKSRIVSVKEVPSKTPISYGRTFYTRRKSVIGVVPVGYADGYPRLLSNRARLLVKGKRVPVVGRICMDMMMIDLTTVRRARVGDEVVLIGRQGQEEIRAEEAASRARTISYEIFCRIAERIPRITR